MSFDVNIGRPQPVIKAAAGMNNDGGSGGNTGFMMRGRKKDNKKNYSLFDNESEIDSFEMASKLPNSHLEDAMGLKNSWLDNIISKFSK